MSGKEERWVPEVEEVEIMAEEGISVRPFALPGERCTGDGNGPLTVFTFSARVFGISFLLVQYVCS